MFKNKRNRPAKLANKSECARFLGIAERTLDKYTSQGKIPCIRLSQKLVRFDLDDVADSLRGLAA